MPRHADHTTAVYLSAPDVIRLVQRKGLSECIAGVAECIERDFLRWQEFDTTARVASHSSDGVIELMPIADAARFAFKYVNGHPLNTRSGLPTVMAFGVPAGRKLGRTHRTRRTCSGCCVSAGSTSACRDLR